mmetsp:Transcript_17669/g.36829  ORF Transcript_17669/g.36829 Transcript_17669/m.36829 type:complete len:152 (-) Transcript_17669:369-824(-)
MSLVILMDSAALQMASMARAASVERELMPAYHVQVALSLTKHLAFTIGTMPAGQIPICLAVWQMGCIQSVASAAKVSMRRFSAQHQLYPRRAGAYFVMSLPRPTIGIQLAKGALSDAGLMAFTLSVAGVVRGPMRTSYAQSELQTAIVQSA